MWQSLVPPWPVHPKLWLCSPTGGRVVPSHHIRGPLPSSNVIHISRQCQKRQHWSDRLWKRPLRVLCFPRKILGMKKCRNERYEFRNRKDRRDEQVLTSHQQLTKDLRLSLDQEMVPVPTVGTVRVPSLVVSTTLEIGLFLTFGMT